MELDWTTWVNILRRVVYALAYFHHDCWPSIVHRDISSNNILLNSEFEAFFGNFGVARLLNSDSSNKNLIVGTYSYIVPGELVLLVISFLFSSFSTTPTIIKLIYFLKLLFCYWTCLHHGYDREMWCLQLWCGDTWILIAKHPQEIRSLFSSTSDPHITLTYILDQRLSPPKKQKIVQDIALASIVVLACLQSKPKSVPTMQRVSQEFLVRKHHWKDLFLKKFPYLDLETRWCIWLITSMDLIKEQNESSSSIKTRCNSII